MARVGALMANTHDIISDPLAIPIQFEWRFARAFVYYACTSPDFWARIGYALPPDLLACEQGQDPARLILKALHELIQGPVDPKNPQKRGAPHKHPASKIIVLNHLYTQSRLGGRITKEQVADCVAYLEDCAAVDLPNVEAVVQQATPQLQRRMLQQAQKHVFEAAADQRQNAMARAKLEEAEKLGQRTARAVLGEALSAGVMGSLGKVGKIPRMSTFISELDSITGGGPRRGEAGFIVGPRNCGKCHAKGQGILMYDGTIRLVEDVRVGDRLMGPDSQPRFVLQTNRGHGEMYEIQPRHGAPWRVNADHILTLDVRGEVVDVVLKDFLKWSTTDQRAAYLVRAPVMFAPSTDPVLLDPYFLGLVLGDGSTTDKTIMITTADPEIVDYLSTIAVFYGLRVSLRAERGAAKSYGIAGVKGKANPIADALRAYGLYRTNGHHKFVPPVYKTGSSATRLAMLAGLLDTDGSHNRHGGFDYISASRQLADDVAFLARSVGLTATVRPCVKSCQTGASGTYYRVAITGDTHMIPCLVSRKRAVPRRRSRYQHRLRDRFAVEKCPLTADYYGFTLDNDGRYLLDDFTITHNSMMLGQLMSAGALQLLHGHYLSMEMTHELVLARIIAGLTGVSINEILDDTSPGHRTAASRLIWMAENGWLGRIKVDFFQSGAPTLQDLWEAIDAEEQETGAAVDLEIYDLDRHIKHLFAPDSTSANYEDMYKKLVARGQGAREGMLRPDPDLARWVVTASHTKYKQLRDEILYTDEDSADSINKGRYMYWAYTVNLRGTPVHSCILNVSRNRNDPTGATPELEVGFVYGQLITTAYPLPWYRGREEDTCTKNSTTSSAPQTSLLLPA